MFHVQQPDLSASSDLRTAIIQALVLILPAVTGAVIAWLAHVRRRLEERARRAVWETEQAAKSDPALRGEEKRLHALSILRRSAPGLSTTRASQMIEAVLPQVVDQDADTLRGTEPPTLRPSLVAEDDDPTERPPPLPPRPRRPLPPRRD